MKRIVPIALMFALALGGCSSQPAATTEEPAQGSAQAAEEQVEETPVEEEVPTIDWVSADSGNAAAEGAGMERFDVPETFKLGDLSFSNPSYSYTSRVVQAVFETPATMVTIRKGTDGYSAPLTDRVVSDFPANWHKMIEGVDVACYGPAKGAVTVATWTYDSNSYAITFQGLGGDEMSMDVDELATLVRGIHEGNANQAAQQQAQQQSQQQSNNNSNSINTPAPASGEPHAEGEAVTIFDNIYAEWHKLNNGQWYATFTTYNGTPVFAQTAPAGGGWAFFVYDNGEQQQIIYNDQESAEVGEYGPAGVSSHWVGLYNDKWY